MKRVTGIGGIFFKSEDPTRLKAWYRDHLGIDAGEHGKTFKWREKVAPDIIGQTVWSPFDAKTDYFDPSEQPFMVNYRVDDLEALLKALEEEGVQIVGEMQVFEYGKFGWVLDPDGTKIELWEPPAGQEFEG